MQNKSPQDTISPYREIFLRGGSHRGVIMLLGPRANGYTRTAVEIVLRTRRAIASCPLCIAKMISHLTSRTESISALIN